MPEVPERFYSGLTGLCAKYRVIPFTEDETMAIKFDTQESFEAAITKEIKSDTESVEKSATGAACFKSIGFASCQAGITREQANRIAAKLGVSVSFYPGKSCSEISC